MKRKTVLTLLQLVLFAALGGGIVWYMLAHMSVADRRAMVDAIEETNVLWMLPFLCAFLISHWARARRWMLMLHPLDIHPTTANTTFAVLIGYLVNLIPPRAGEVAKCTVLARYENVPADKMIGTIVAERSFDVICLLLIIAVGLYWQQEALNTYLADELRGRAPSTGKLLLTGLIAGLLLGVMIAIYRRNRQSRVGRFIGGLGAGFTSIFHLKKRSMFLLYSLLIWGSYLAQVLFGFQAMAATLHLGSGAALMTLIFGSVAIIASPGGIGLYPFLVGQLLHSGYGVSLPEANAFGWVSWMALTVATVLCGVASLLLLPIYNRQPHDSQAPVDPEPHS
jgi:hypothetical protein